MYLKYNITASAHTVTGLCKDISIAGERVRTEKVTSLYKLKYFLIQTHLQL